MPDPARTLEVLVVEDNPGDVKLIREGLKRSTAKLPMNIRIAEDGEQALNLLIREKYQPDMILIDLNLPKIDGQTVIQRVRAEGVNLVHTPIVVFSSKQHGIQEVLDAGATAYIVKPMGLADYLKAIEKVAILWLQPPAKPANA
jgi:CheY-like chemotaxis protein